MQDGSPECKNEVEAVLLDKDDHLSRQDSGAGEGMIPGSGSFD